MNIVGRSQKFFRRVLRLLQHDVSHLIAKIPRAEVRQFRPWLLAFPPLSRVVIALLLPGYMIIMLLQVEFWRYPDARGSVYTEFQEALKAVFLPWDKAHLFDETRRQTYRSSKTDRGNSHLA